MFFLSGLKVCKKIGTSEPMKKLGSKPFETKMVGCEEFDDDDDQYFECLAKSVAITFSHQAGTARMGNPKDKETVVDPRLKYDSIAISNLPTL